MLDRVASIRHFQRWFVLIHNSSFSLGVKLHLIRFFLNNTEVTFGKVIYLSSQFHQVIFQMILLRTEVLHCVVAILHIDVLLGAFFNLFSEKIHPFHHVHYFHRVRNGANLVVSLHIFDLLKEADDLHLEFTHPGHSMVFTRRVDPRFFIFTFRSNFSHALFIWVRFNLLFEVLHILLHFLFLGFFMCILLGRCQFFVYLIDTGLSYCLFKIGFGLHSFLFLFINRRSIVTHGALPHELLAVSLLVT